MHKLRHAIFTACLAAILLVLLQFYWAVTQRLTPPGFSGILLVEQGDTLTKAIYQLQDQGWLSHGRWLLWYAKYREETAIRQGEYELTRNMTGKTLLQHLSSGRVLQYQVTLVEGSTLTEAVQILSSQEKMVNDIHGIDAESYKALFGFAPEFAEGRFSPDTYNYVRGTKMSEVLLQARHHMRAILDEEWKNRAKDLPYENAYQALIMASIIEKETGVAGERAQIAGVFVRRLQKGMRLQTDPSVIYGLGGEFEGDLKRHHLSKETPYNTYIINGLPPTPIALPGRASIHAALHPAEGTFMYFVARGDGTHIFSTTYAQHLSAVAQYQSRRAEGYRSSPSEPHEKALKAAEFGKEIESKKR